MIIHAKLGTMPASYYRVKRKRNLKAGDRIHVRDTVGQYTPQWEGAKVDKVTTVDGRPFYFLSRW